MKNYTCPNCGRYASRCDTYCSNCGTSLAGDPSRIKPSRCEEECTCMNTCNAYKVAKDNQADKSELRKEFENSLGL
jgi:hypothetical protein